MEEKLVGTLSGESELTGILSGTAVLYGQLSIPDHIGTPYQGSYDIVPAIEFQLLPTAETYLDDDIIVHPIPYQEVSNPYGGITVTIGE